MTKLLAFLKRDFQENLSYKTAFILRLFSTLAHLVSLYFVAKLIEGGNIIYLKKYGGDYFPFVLIGILLSEFQAAMLSGFTQAITREQGEGTLEAILATSTSIGTVLLSGVVWRVFYTTIRLIFIVVLCIFVFRLDLTAVNIPSSLTMILLTLASLAGIGIFSSGISLLFKGADPISFFANSLSRFLAGVYFPVALFPLWVQKISNLLPFTHGLEALRRAVLDGAGIYELRFEIFTLFAFSVFFLLGGIAFFQYAYKKSLTNGSLYFR